MDCYIIVARKKTQIILDLKEDTPILELKRMVGGILRVSPANMKLVCLEKEESGKEMEDHKKIYDYGINSFNTKPAQPKFIGLRCRDEDGNWEELNITHVPKPGLAAPSPRLEKPSQSQ